MASSYRTFPRTDVAIGLSVLSTARATEKWSDCFNFKFYRGYCDTPKRLTEQLVLTPTTAENVSAVTPSFDIIPPVLLLDPRYQYSGAAPQTVAVGGAVPGVLKWPPIIPITVIPPSTNNVNYIKQFNTAYNINNTTGGGEIGIQVGAGSDFGPVYIPLDTVIFQANDYESTVGIIGMQWNYFGSDPDNPFPEGSMDAQCQHVLGIVDANCVLNFTDLMWYKAVVDLVSEYFNWNTLIVLQDPTGTTVFSYTQGENPGVYDMVTQGSAGADVSIVNPMIGEWVLSIECSFVSVLWDNSFNYTFQGNYNTVSL